MINDNFVFPSGTITVADQFEQTGEFEVYHDLKILTYWHISLGQTTWQHTFGRKFQQPLQPGQLVLRFYIKRR
jgi:hypothetical protein